MTTSSSDTGVNHKERRKVGVLLAAHNGALSLQPQVESIVNQVNVSVELFVSIDVSTDDTCGICARLSEQSQNISILPSTQKFGSAAPNFFRLLRDVNFSDIDYVAFADQDDIWHADKLSRAVEVMMGLGYEGYSSNVTAFWPDGRAVLIDKAQAQVEWDYLFESAGPGCTFVMSQKLVLELQSFIQVNERVMSSVWLHDWFVYAFARSSGYKWYIDSYPSMLYRQHENNQVGVNLGYKALVHRARFVLSGKALEQSSLLALICGLRESSFVEKWYSHSRVGMLFLAFSAGKCRRKRSEKILFAFTCLILSLVGSKK